MATEIEKASAMKTIRIAVASVVLAAVVVGSAMAQTTAVATYGGNASGSGPTVVGRQMTPLATFGNLAVGIWTPVPRPYDASANYNGAANPLP